MQQALILAVLIATTFTGVWAAAPLSGQVTELRIVGIQVRNGTMVVEILHNGAFGPPDGPGLLHAWVNEFGGVCHPGENKLTVAVPVWRLPLVKPAETLLTVYAFQAGTNAHLEVKYTAAEIQSIQEGNKSVCRTDTKNRLSSAVYHSAASTVKHNQSQ